MKSPMVIVLGVLALIAVGYYMMSDTDLEDPQQNYMAKAVEPMTLTCAACKHSFDLTPDEYASQDSARGEGEKFTCPACGEKQAWRGNATVQGVQVTLQKPARNNNSDEDVVEEVEEQAKPQARTTNAPTMLTPTKPKN